MSSSIPHVATAVIHYEGETSPIRAANEIEVDLVERRQQLKRAWRVVLAPRADGTIGGRRRDSRRLALHMVQKFTEEVAELEDELYKSRCFEWWVEDVAGRAGSWFGEGAWGDEGGERDLVWEEAGEAERKEEEMVESVGRRCRWDT
ncbi:hypothetical protein J4E86_001417 [Alternaria arbusti]|uniref:uncharacterized protein n=1 Tax=Alternaria arbusti TaxID=232088 RepID=UPI00221F208E|nr:uncharacterized protein J4E86_001417 [Alternaria arbusti]KAI4962383.1 hypothetical protein J4E86_001417 [Alternaria arbusti]